MNTTTMGVKLNEETRERLKTLGEKRDRSPHWLMKQAINRYLDAEERYEREKAEDEARYQHYLDTGQHISNEEMMAWFDELEAKADAKVKASAE